MKLIERFKKSSFARNVAKLASGTILAQAISILTAPILYRIYDKEAYGTLGVYMAVTGVLAPLMTGQFFHGVLLEKKDDNALGLANILTKLNLLVGILIAGPCIIASSKLAHYLNNPAIEPWLWFVPASFIVGGRVEVLKTWANRHQDYNILTLFVIGSAVIIPIGSISFAAITEGATGLFVGLFLGQSLPWLGLEYTYIRKQAKLPQPTYQSLSKRLTHHFDFFRFTLPAEFLNRLIQQLPVFILSALAGPAIVGVFNLTIRMLGLPIQIVATSVTEVFRQKATTLYKTTGNCSALLRSTTKGLSLLISPALLTIIVFGPDLFGIAFGDNWTEAGEFARILAIPFSLKFVVSPLSYMFMIANRQRLDLLLHILSLGLFAGLMVVGHQLASTTGMIAGYGLTMTVIYILYGYVSIQLARGHES